MNSDQSPPFQNIANIFQAQSVDHWGALPLKKPLTLEHYQKWIQKDFHGNMDYMKAHLPQKENPQLLMPLAQSIFIISQPYHPHPKPDKPLPGLQTALYAQGEDYHFWLKEKLNILSQELQKLYPKNCFMTFTDSSPILERDFAQQASLGWYGKNTCLIHPKKGSLFLLGEILSDLDLTKIQEPETLPDMCGKCTKCIEACPTQALIEPRVLDARKCISYLTIESQEIPDIPLRKKIGSWFFGCDICQTVCPWNQKILKTNPLPQINRKEMIESLSEILTTSGKKLTEKLKKSPLSRSRPFGLKRNALIVIGNENLFELKPEVEKYFDHERLSELAHWAYDQLKQT